MDLTATTVRATGEKSTAIHASVEEHGPRIGGYLRRMYGMLFIGLVALLRTRVGDAGAEGGECLGSGVDPPVLASTIKSPWERPGRSPGIKSPGWRPTATAVWPTAKPVLPQYNSARTLVAWVKPAGMQALPKRT
jgi:hypothetical protein